MRRSLFSTLLALLAALALFVAPAGAQEDEGDGEDILDESEEGGSGSDPGGGANDGEEPDEEAEECIEILEGGGSVDECQEAPNPILPELNEIIWGTLAFAVILGALSAFGLPAIRKGMDARADKIRSSLDEAERAKTEAQAVLTEYQGQVAGSQAEATRIIEEARGQAETVRRDLIAKAEAEAAELRQRNADSIAVERERVLSEVQGQVGSLAIELAEKVVEGNLDRDANLRLIESYIASVGRNGGTNAMAGAGASGPGTSGGAVSGQGTGA